MMKRFGIALLVVSAGVAGVCWSRLGSGSPSAEPELPTLPAITAAADLVLPLDAFQVSPGESVVLYRARWQQASTCASRFGVVSTEPSSTDTPGVRSGRRYGLPPDAPVQTDGYRSAEPADRPAGLPEWRPGEAEVRVLFGMSPTGGDLTDADRPRTADGTRLPDGGCLAEARRSLSGGADWDVHLPERLASEAFALAERDSRTQAAWHEWATCMGGRGHSYSSPWEPNDQDWGARPSEAEVVTATDDLACRRQSRVVDIWFAVETAYQHRLVADNRDALERWEQTLDDRVGRAQALLATRTEPR
jgi:hypothetical protein